MANVLVDLSEALARTVESAGAGVVRVEARRRLAATGIVWSADGVIVTADHAVRQDEGIEVGLADGGVVPADLAGRDSTTDLAVLRAKATGLVPLAWAGPDSIRVGNLALALGRPGRTVQATLGIVSALGEAWRTPGGGEVDRYLQTDVVMYPGFSGGPLVGSGAQVLGLNTSGLLRGISLAVPSSTVQRVVEALLTHGRVRRGYLGIGAQPVRLPEATAKELDQETGVLLMSVETGGPAAQGGLMLGDTIVAMDGQPVRHMEDLLALLTGDRVGKSMSVRLLRGGRLEERPVVMGERD
jgi:S1-C subfamily serine protease